MATGGWIDSRTLQIEDGLELVYDEAGQAHYVIMDNARDLDARSLEYILAEQGFNLWCDATSWRREPNFSTCVVHTEEYLENAMTTGKARKYYIVEQAQGGLWNQVGHFTTKPAAERFRTGLSGRTRVVHTWPSAHDHPAQHPNARGGALDEHAATELKLYIDNTAELMGPRSQGEDIRKNLMRKLRAGKFDLHKSIKAWEYLAEAGARRYDKEFGTGNWAQVFSVATRREVARELAEEFYTEAKLGNYNHLAPERPVSHHQNASRRYSSYEDQEEIHPEVAGFKFYQDDVAHSIHHKPSGMVVMVDDDGRDVFLVNPLEVPRGKSYVQYGRRLGEAPYILWFGAHAPTRLFIWARSLEAALEEAAGTLADHFPGLIMQHDDPQLKELYDEAREELVEDGDEDPDEGEVMEKATADLTYTESGYIPSYEWGIDSDPEGHTWTEAVEAATAMSEQLYRDEYGEDE